jgi:F-type H+-transporting ATPase subunit delta
VARRASARRYSQAAFQIALEQKELDRWESDLRKVSSITEDVAIAAVFENPKIDFKDKEKLLSERLDKINPQVLNLIYLLMARGNLNMVGEIADEYQRLLSKHRGIVEAEVITAVPLDDEDKLKLGERLRAIVGKEVMVKPVVNPGVIGGMVIRFDGKLLDGSTRSRLKALQRELGGRAK